MYSKLHCADMTYEEAISLAKEGYYIGRECWGEGAYITASSNSTSRELIYCRSEIFGDMVLSSCHNYYASPSDMKATDWREIIK